MMGWFSNLFGPRKVEITINVPAIHVFVTRSEEQGKAGSSECRSVSSSDAGGYSVSASTDKSKSVDSTISRATEDECIDKLTNKLGSIGQTTVKFGQE